MGKGRVTLSFRPVLVAWAALAFLAACERPMDPIESISASSATVGRAGTAAALVAAVKAGDIKPGDAVNAAFARVEADANTPAQRDAAVFAGAVLDMLSAVEGTLNHGGEFEFFWRRVGRLAYQSAAAASASADVPLARSLVLAGPRRWQNEPYWLAYPDHDGLASLIMATLGERSEALARLSRRTMLTGDAEAVYEQLRRGR